MDTSILGPAFGGFGANTNAQAGGLFSAQKPAATGFTGFGQSAAAPTMGATAGGMGLGSNMLGGLYV